MKINTAINRIILDQKLYSKYNLSISNVFIQCLIIIEKIEKNERNNLVKRLYEELIEMYETCSSGHIIRILNIFSGTEFNFLSVNIYDEIQSTLFNRLGKIIYTFEDEIIEKITTELENDQIFLKYLSIHINTIKEEMFKEYKDICNIQLFEEYYRRALNNFQTGFKI